MSSAGSTPTRISHGAEVVGDRGKLLDAEEFETTAAGYTKLLAWMQSFGTLDKVGVEGTGANGAGLARHLATEGITVMEVHRPNRQMRRRRGKSDSVDAEAAARAALSDEATVVPKSKDSLVESIRVLREAYTSVRNSRTRVTLQIRDLVLTGPIQLRAVLGPLTSEAQAHACARLRPGDVTVPAEATKYAFHSLGRRHQSLTIEMADLNASLNELTALANPALRAAKGVGPDVAANQMFAAGHNPERLNTEAAFAALCGASPIEVFSGKVNRHCEFALSVPISR